MLNRGRSFAWRCGRKTRSKTTVPSWSGRCFQDMDKLSLSSLETMRMKPIGFAAATLRVVFFRKLLQFDIASQRRQATGCDR